MSAEFWILAFAVLLAIGWAKNRRDVKEKAKHEAERRASLLAKYGSSQFVEDIVAGSIRQGMTAEMVIDAWGTPAAVDRKVYKTKLKETWKYGPLPRRMFANKVVMEDGVVVGWESR